MSKKVSEKMSSRIENIVIYQNKTKKSLCNKFVKNDCSRDLTVEKIILSKLGIQNYVLMFSYLPLK